MLPFTVSSASRRPPLPIVPRRLRGPSRPVTMRGKSVWMSPLTVLARTSVERPAGRSSVIPPRSEEHTSELQSQSNLVCRLLLEKKKIVVYKSMQSSMLMTKAMQKSMKYKLRGLAAKPQHYPNRFFNRVVDLRTSQPDLKNSLHG